jgi:hypothetical protein
MAHFAKLDEVNTVTEVVVVSNDVAPNEAAGIAFLTDWSGGYTRWKQTSYNASMRKNFAGIGFYYDAVRDAFIPPKPFPSWTLDETLCQWKPPVPCPGGQQLWHWNEKDKVWE